LLVLCTLAAIWAVVLAFTGGFVVHLGPVRVSSRTPRNAIVIALFAGLTAGALWLPRWRRTMREDWSWLRQVGARAFPPQRTWLRRASPASAIAVAGIGLTIAQWAAARPLWLDEEMIALNVRDRGLAELAGPLWLGQSAPFGWLVLQRTAVLVDTSERALRLVPMLFGIATVAAAVWVGRRWMGHVGAAVLVLLCSIGHWLSFYALELKQYSADAFFALLLPALGAWAIEDGPTIPQTRRVAVWWAAAAVGHWFGVGALLVTPACALVLALIVWRRQGRHAAGRFALFGFVWAASFGLHYLVALRDTAHSDYLREYWAFAMPPAAAGVSGTLGWLAANVAPLADNPGGTGLWLYFWLCAAGGFALSTPSTPGLLFATVPLSAFALAAFRIVPLYGRLSLWVVPAMYVGIALFGDRVLALGRDAFIRRRWIRLAAAVPVALVVLQLCSDIARRGWYDFQVARPATSNHQLDDRTGVRWLMRHRQPGDALFTTHLALPAVWWYGAIPISRGDSAARPGNGSQVFEVVHQPPGPECERNQLGDALKGRTLALVYFGFRFGVPEGFDDLLLLSLGELGHLAAYDEFAAVGRAAVFELHTSSADEPARPREPRRRPVRGTARLDGCIGLRPAARW
jgi:hypothetical protein